MPSLAIAPSELFGRPRHRAAPPPPIVSIAGMAAMRRAAPALLVPNVLAMVKRREASSPCPAPAPLPPPPPLPMPNPIPEGLREQVVPIYKMAAQAAGVGFRDLTSARRTADIVKPRQVAFFIAHRFTKASLPTLGNRMGGRDHTTALHGIRKVEAMLSAIGEPAQNTPEAWAVHLLGAEWTRAKNGAASQNRPQPRSAA